MTQTEKVLYMLRGGTKTTRDFLHSDFLVGNEFRARISELRNKGFQITAKRIDAGNWSYTLVEPKKDLFV